MRIAFVGLGNMGEPMAANLVVAGHEVHGYDVAVPAIERAVARGVKAAPSPAGACSEAQAVVTMLPAGQDVEDVYAGRDGILDALSRETLLVDASTIDVATARRLAARAEKGAHAMLDAPVSGGVIGAENATLTFMVGGSPQAFESAQPLFEAMGQKSVLAGGPGAGQAAKACNNMLLGISMIGLSEAFTLGERLGIEPETLFAITSAASGCSWAMLHHLPIPGIVETSAANREFRPGFAAAMMLKDLSLAQEAAMPAWSAVDAQMPRVSPLPQRRIADVQHTAGIPKRKPLAFTRKLIFRQALVDQNTGNAVLNSVKTYNNPNYFLSTATKSLAHRPSQVKHFGMCMDS